MENPSVPSVEKPASKPPKKWLPSWLVVLQRYVSKSKLKNRRGLRLWKVYRMMGWNDGQAYWKKRAGRGKDPSRDRQLAPTELALMAVILKKHNRYKGSIGDFMEEVVTETGIPEPVPWYTARREIDRMIVEDNPAGGRPPINVGTLKRRLKRDPTTGRFALHGKRRKSRKFPPWLWPGLARNRRGG